MRNFNTIDLFAGAGGLSYGFLETGYFKVKVAVEHNINAQKTYLRNHDCKVIESDIRHVSYAELIKKHGKFDIVIGGPPCQGFSNANRQKNDLISGNNQLVNEYIRAVEELQPIAFAMENVKTINSNKHKFFCSESLLQSVQELKVKLSEETIIIADATILPEKFVMFLQDSKNFSEFALTKENYMKINTIYRNSKSNERLAKYMNKSLNKVNKLVNMWNDMHLSFWSEEYKKVFLDTRSLLLDYLSNNSNYENLRAALKIIIESQKAIYKMQEIRDYKIILKDVKLDKKNICIVVNTYNVIDYVLSKFRSMGYIVNSGVLNAANFGVPQCRERYIIIGIKKDQLKTLEVKLPEPIIKNGENFYTVGQAIEDLAEYQICTDIFRGPIIKNRRTQKNYLLKYLDDSDLLYNHVITDTRNTALERFKKIKPGQNFHHLDESLKTTYSEPERTQNTIYLRLSYNTPSGTVVNVRKSMWIHPEQDRAISIREAARLQSFPDSFVFCGTKDAQYQQVGNAVPPLLGRAIAEKMLEMLGIQLTRTLKYYIVDNRS